MAMPFRPALLAQKGRASQKGDLDAVARASLSPSGDPRHSGFGSEEIHGVNHASVLQVR
jgi:hypothetical protein